jgi:hypothetical protein
MAMEQDVAALTVRLPNVEQEQIAQRQTLDHVLQVVVDVHGDINSLRKEVQGLRHDLPEIIARAVAPLLKRDEDQSD